MYFVYHIYEKILIMFEFYSCVEVPSQIVKIVCLDEASKESMPSPEACRDGGYTISAVRVLSRLARLARLSAFLQVVY